MLHDVINYQHVSIAFPIVIGVALQKYKEYNNMPQIISGTTHYNKCLNIEYFNLHNSYFSFGSTLMVMTKVIDSCW